MQIFILLFRYMQIRWFSPRTRKSLRRVQERKKRKLYKRLIKKIPFYQNLKINSNLPVITKPFYKQHFAEFNCMKIELDQAMQAAADLENGRTKKPLINTIYAGLSTGTSGNRGVFLTSQSERMRWSSIILARALPDPIWVKAKLALLLRANNPLYETTAKSTQIQFAYFNINLDFSHWLPRLIAYQPTILVAQPSALLWLANEASDRLKPKYIFSGADILDQSDKKKIEGAFGIKVREIYQATEGFLGTSCRFGTLHLNEDLIQFEQEFLDDERKYFIPIITDFHRSTQAMVRFRLNDVLLSQTNPCRCGSPLLGLVRVDGRADEVFLVPESNEKYTRLFRGELIRTLEPILDGAGDFRLEQHGPSDFILFTATPWSSERLELLRTELTRLWFGQEITLNTRDGFSLNLVDKRRRIVRSFPDPAGVL